MAAKAENRTNKVNPIAVMDGENKTRAIDASDLKEEPWRLFYFQEI